MAEEKAGPALSLNLATENEWEVVNDDGFVYKRQKSKYSAPAPFPSNTTANNDDQYLKQRRLLKKAGLLNLKSRYALEIKEWESLSQMSQTAATSIINSSINPKSSSSSPPQTQIQNARKYIFRELLQQAEAQETFIQEVTSFCNAAELMCEVHEQDFRRSALDFLIWDSPTTLVHSLCPSDSEENA